MYKFTSPYGDIVEERDLRKQNPSPWEGQLSTNSVTRGLCRHIPAPQHILVPAAPRLRSSCNRKQTFTALDTFLIYYCQGEKATKAQQATSKIFPKNNSVQNRSVSEFLKKERNLYMSLKPIPKHKRKTNSILDISSRHTPFPSPWGAWNEMSAVLSMHKMHQLV